MITTCVNAAALFDLHSNVELSEDGVVALADRWQQGSIELSARDAECKLGEGDPEPVMHGFVGGNLIVAVEIPGKRGGMDYEE